MFSNLFLIYFLVVFLNKLFLCSSLIYFIYFRAICCSFIAFTVLTFSLDFSRSLEMTRLVAGLKLFCSPILFCGPSFINRLFLLISDPDKSEVPLSAVDFYDSLPALSISSKLILSPTTSPTMFAIEAFSIAWSRLEGDREPIAMASNNYIGFLIPFRLFMNFELIYVVFGVSLWGSVFGVLGWDEDCYWSTLMFGVSSISSSNFLISGA